MEKKALRDIRDLTEQEITQVLQEMGEPRFRGKQIYEWIWKRGADNFQAMTNISKDLRLKLESVFSMSSLHIDLQQKSSDGTLKCRFILWDGNYIEGVLIPTEDRITACISSQVGCSLGCKFCATGYMKTRRNLDVYEIYQQVFLLNVLAEKQYQKHITNIVFMGMGEPLLNYKNVLAAIAKITSPEGMGMSARRITLSTAGIAKMIRKLADDNVKFNLALSLHAADDLKRSALMPINESNPLSELTEALNYFYDRTRNRITFEYILFEGINETEEDARNLVKLCKRTGAKVNIIEYNTIAEADYHKSREQQRSAFIAHLEAAGVVAKVRRSRGKDIDAACGQLANRG